MTGAIKEVAISVLTCAMFLVQKWPFLVLAVGLWSCSGSAPPPIPATDVTWHTVPVSQYEVSEPLYPENAAEVRLVYRRYSSQGVKSYYLPLGDGPIYECQTGRRPSDAERCDIAYVFPSSREEIVALVETPLFARPDTVIHRTNRRPSTLTILFVRDEPGGVLFPFQQLPAEPFPDREPLSRAIRTVGELLRGF